jgi:hypothetical protein
LALKDLWHATEADNVLLIRFFLMRALGSIWRRGV